jgi:hypothetical protein
MLSDKFTKIEPTVIVCARNLNACAATRTIGSRLLEASFTRIYQTANFMCISASKHPEGYKAA